MDTVYDWLSARGDRAARDGRRNRRQREWPAMSGDTVDCSASDGWADLLHSPALFVDVSGARLTPILVPRLRLCLSSSVRIALAVAESED
jgi:hypothetical protein